MLWRMPKIADEPHETSREAQVSIIIPARNEEKRLGHYSRPFSLKVARTWKCSSLTTTLPIRQRILPAHLEHG